MKANLKKPTSREAEQDHLKSRKAVLELDAYLGSTGSSADKEQLAPKETTDGSDSRARARHWSPNRETRDRSPSPDYLTGPGHKVGYSDSYPEYAGTFVHGFSSSLKPKPAMLTDTPFRTVVDRNDDFVTQYLQSSSSSTTQSRTKSVGPRCPCHERALENQDCNTIRRRSKPSRHH